MHRAIQGEPAELVDLFIELLDREPAADRYWWYNFGALTGLHIDLYLPQDIDRGTAMQHLRQRLSEVLESGLSESFLIKHLKAELDDFVAKREDPSFRNAQVDRMREVMQNVIDDPVARDRWRRAMAVDNPSWATKTDEEVVADAKRTLESSVTTRYMSVDEVADGWAVTAEWRRLTDALLPNQLFEHWASLNTQRAIERQRRRRARNLGSR